MEYKLKPLEFNIESIDELSIPAIEDRVIEKRGHVIEFTLNQVNENTKHLEKTVKEIKGKREIEEAKMKNIEGFHKFVLKMSEQDLFTAWLYQESKGLVKMCNEKIEQIEKQMENDAIEVEEIKKQIPELNKEVTNNKDAGQNQE